MAVFLQQLIKSGQEISVRDLNLAGNKPLTLEIQTQLCDLGLMDPIIGGDEETPFGPIKQADGKVGLETQNALFVFHHHAGLPYIDNHLSLTFFETLDRARANTFLPIQFDNQPTDNQQTRLAKRILRYMVKKGYWIARSPYMFNIVYVEGLDPDGQPNQDQFNEWNDRRMVIRILPGGQPEMVVNDQATTEPGRFYTADPLNPLGAARIAFGQYKAWTDGIHKGYQPALVQRGLLRLHRDIDKNGVRNASDPIDIGAGFGINQHSTDASFTPAFVDKFSAGCLVGRRYRWHHSFMQIIRQDIRYAMNKGYMFMSTIIDGDDFSAVEPM